MATPKHDNYPFYMTLIAICNFLEVTGSLHY